MGMFETIFKGIRIKVVQGDITKIESDAVVNPANSFGYMGGGVALAIKQVGGEEIEKEAVSKAPISLGKAVATTAGKLKAKFVIHAPTMVNAAEETDGEKVRLATFAALQCAEQNSAKSIAIPGMGTGVGGLSYEKAAQAMVDAIKEFLSRKTKMREILLVAYNKELYNCFTKELISNPQSSSGI